MPVEVLAPIAAFVAAMLGAGAVWGLTRGRVDSNHEAVVELKSKLAELERVKASRADLERVENRSASADLLERVERDTLAGFARVEASIATMSGQISQLIAAMHERERS